MEMEHELGLINAFVIKGRQQRYINLLLTKKGRSKFRSYVAHFKDIDSQFCLSLHSNIKTASSLYDLLKSKGAPDSCYIISENSNYDQKKDQLQNALVGLFNSGIAYFISCIPGKLVYYAGEDLNSCYLLQK